MKGICSRLFRTRATQGALALFCMVLGHSAGAAAQAQINDKYFDGTWAGEARVFRTATNPGPLDKRVCPSRPPSSEDIRRLPFRLEVSSVPNAEVYAQNEYFTGIMKKGTFNGVEWVTGYGFSPKSPGLPALHMLYATFGPVPTEYGSSGDVECWYDFNLSLNDEVRGKNYRGLNRTLTCKNEVAGIVSTCYWHDMDIMNIKREGRVSRLKQKRRSRR